MKRTILARPLVLALGLGLAVIGFAQPVLAVDLVWDGGGNPDFHWSNHANWVDESAGFPDPGFVGDTVVFSGSTGLTNENDLTGLLLGTNAAPAFRFDSTAGNFVISGQPVQVGVTTGSGNIIVLESASTQTLGMNINFPGGLRDRGLVAAGGTVIFDGSINFGNDRLFPQTSAGTIELNGNNNGDGTNAVTAGTNFFRSTVRNNVDNTQLVLGSNTAFGNPGTGTYAGGNLVLRGIVANNQMNVRASTPLDLSAYAFSATSGGGSL